MRPAHLLLGAFVLVACSSSSSPAGTTSDSGTDTPITGDPTIKITSPANNASLTVADLTDGTDLMISYTSTNFTLKSPGTCAGAKSCGHVHVYVDGTACNDTASHLPANVEDSANPIHAGMDYCASITGTHTVKLELHFDDHSAVKVGGNNVADQISITIAGGSDAGTDGG